VWIGFSIPISSVYAQDSSQLTSLLRISPVILKLQIKPGSKQVYSIKVDNLASIPVPVQASIEGFDPSDEDSGVEVSSNTNTVSPLSSWMALDHTDTIIPARSSDKFFVRISIPQTVPLGGYYAMIYFTPLTPGLSIGSKIGVITLANIGVEDSLKKRGDILEFSFDKPVYESNPVGVHIRVKNISLNYFTAKPTLSITPLLGKTQRLDLEEKVILPDKIRSWKPVFTIQNYKWGVYNIKLSVSLEQGLFVEESKYIIVFPVRQSILLLILILLLLFIISKRKNMKRAILALLGKPYPETNITPTPQDHRIPPSTIMQALTSVNGSARDAATILGVHRSTVHRWSRRADDLLSDSSSISLVRKSTRPHKLRTSSISAKHIQQIVHLRELNWPLKRIQNNLDLRISLRTIERIIKKQNLTRSYSKKSDMRE